MVSIEEANEMLESGDSPAVVKTEDDPRKPYVCKHHLILESGWLKTDGFEKPVVIYPPQRVLYVQPIDTTAYFSTEEGVQDRTFTDDQLDTLRTMCDAGKLEVV